MKNSYSALEVLCYLKLVLENQPFLMPEPAEKLSLQVLCYLQVCLVNRDFSCIWKTVEPSCCQGDFLVVLARLELRKRVDMLVRKECHVCHVRRAHNYFVHIIITSVQGSSAW